MGRDVELFAGSWHDLNFIWESTCCHCSVTFTFCLVVHVVHPENFAADVQAACQGAVIEEDISESTTHVIAKRDLPSAETKAKLSAICSTR